MRVKSAKIMGLAMVLLVLGGIVITGLRAQQIVRNSNPATLTTNWVGYLVAGRTDTLDRLSRAPSPTVIGRVEIGLRSDGVVIWRDAPKVQ